MKQELENVSSTGNSAGEVTLKMTVEKRNKKLVREKILDKRQNLDAGFKRKADESICEKLLQLPELKQCRLAGAYVSDGTEPDLKVFIDRFIESRGKLFLPRSYKRISTLEYEMAEIFSLKNDLIEGAYGIPEPKQELYRAGDEQVRTMNWLVPGVAFDDQGRRLGRGKGFYDRLLNSGKGIKIGVFYECQRIDAVPVETHDQLLDIIVTEKNVYRIKQLNGEN